MRPGNSDRPAGLIERQLQLLPTLAYCPSKYRLPDAHLWIPSGSATFVAASTTFDSRVDGFCDVGQRRFAQDRSGIHRQTRSGLGEVAPAVSRALQDLAPGTEVPECVTRVSAQAPNRQSAAIPRVTSTSSSPTTDSRGRSPRRPACWASPRIAPTTRHAEVTCQ